MSKNSSLDEALKRTSLSRSNQMEMLTFRLTDNQVYGINVFKIIEIIECPSRFDRMPHAHQSVKGAVNFRGKPIVAIDLAEAVGLEPVRFEEQLSYLIICEYSQQLNAFIISTPETLLTRGWEEIHKPEGIQAKSLVAIAYTDLKETILMLDIEGILADVIGYKPDISDDRTGLVDNPDQYSILLVDDSKTALMMMQQTLDRLGLKHISQQSAVHALAFLDNHTKAEEKPFDLIISDIEMPGMDGFTFTRNIRTLPAYQKTRILLHSSMSNPTNQIKAEEAGADDFVAKFDPNTLADHVFKQLGIAKN